MLGPSLSPIVGGLGRWAPGAFGPHPRPPYGPATFCDPELEGLLSEDLRRELGALAPRIEGVPAEPEIRVAPGPAHGVA